MGASGHCDAAVIGGGPAGCSAARALLRAGYSVVLLASTPGAPRFGQTLPRSCVPTLRRAGFGEEVLAAQSRCGALLSAWGSGSLVTHPGAPEPYGYLLERDSLDAALQATVAAAGGRVAQARAVQVERDGARWTIAVERQGLQERVHAVWLVDASGRANVLGRVLRLRRRMDDALVATWAQTGPGEHDPGGPAVVESAPDGWWYTAPTPAGARLFVYYTDGDDDASRLARSKGAFAQALANTRHAGALVNAGALDRLEPGGRAGARSSLSRTPAGDGWALAGDAVMTVDPLSSQGIALALETGMIAASAVLDGPDGARAYAAALSTRYAAFLVQRSETYSAESRWPGHRFWARRRRSAPEDAFTAPPGATSRAVRPIR